MSFTMPADIANQALDSIGSPATLGDLQEGTREAKAALRWYAECLRQLLRAAHWDFCRRRAALVLLNDATGQTTQNQIAAGINPPTVGTGTVGMRPWIYEYQYPGDCMKARFMPAALCPNPGSQISGNISLPTTPLMTGLATPPVPVHDIPTRFLVGMDSVPTLIGNVTSWNQYPDYQNVQGQSPAQQTVVLCNQPNAQLVYSALIESPDQWDPLFRQAFVALLASHLAFPVLEDKKLAVTVRAQQSQLAKDALTMARVSDGNEGWNQIDIGVDWMRIRNTGGWAGNGWGYGNGEGPGVFYYGWSACGLGDGSAF